VTLSTTVTGSGLTPTGIVSLYDGSGLLGQSMLNSSGVGTVTTTNLVVGNNNITASYQGDSNYNTANSATIVVVVAAPGTSTPTMMLTPSAASVTDQQNVTVAVSVAGASGQPTPTGVLALAAGTYNTQQTLANGMANVDIPAGTLSSGSNTISVTYLGDANYKSISQTTTVTVSPVLMTASTPAPAAPGAMGTATVSLSAGSTYSGTIKLACSQTNSPSGAQSLPTCSLNPASVAITAGGNGTTTLSLQTTAAATTALALPSHLSLWGLGGGSALACLIMLGVPSRGRRMSMLGLLLIVFAIGATGCGGGGSSTETPSKPGTPATTAGNYIFTVTGTDSAHSSIALSTTVTLTVQ
jgi:Bacterial Ig-like domain (group 3)